jgi:hypothetical protein
MQSAQYYEGADPRMQQRHASPLPGQVSPQQSMVPNMQPRYASPLAGVDVRQGPPPTLGYLPPTAKDPHGLLPGEDVRRFAAELGQEEWLSGGTNKSGYSGNASGVDPPTTPRFMHNNEPPGRREYHGGPSNGRKPSPVGSLDARSASPAKRLPGERREGPPVFGSQQRGAHQRSASPGRVFDPRSTSPAPVQQGQVLGASFNQSAHLGRQTGPARHPSQSSFARDASVEMTFGRDVPRHPAS